MDKNDINAFLCEFEEDNVGPAQLTEEWYKIRNQKFGEYISRIGGSEIASLLGENPYNTVKQLVNYKAGLQERKIGGDMACWYGTIFEEVAVRVTERLQQTKIYCKNISIIDACIVGMMYSPDGFIALPVNKKGEPMLNIHATCDSDIDSDEDIPHEVFLVEIKCPFRRAPKPDMPTYYKAQLQAGFLNAPFVQGAIFIDNLFRICKLYQMLENDPRFSFDLYPNSPYINKHPILFGYILLDTVDLTVKKNIDAGMLSYKVFESTMEGVNAKKYTIRYSKIYYSSSDCITDLNKEISNFFICWKLLDIRYTYVPRDKKHMDKIYKCVTSYLAGGYNHLLDIRPS